MNELCLAVRRALEDEGPSRFTEHLRSCRACRAHADMVRLLEQLDPGEADPTAVKAIMTALPPARWQRQQVRTWLPLAAGLALVALGLVLLGGVPATGAVAALPGAAGSFVARLAGWFADARVATRGGADAVRSLVAAGGFSVLVWLVLALVGAGWAVAGLARSTSGRSR